MNLIINHQCACARGLHYSVCLSVSQSVTIISKMAASQNNMAFKKSNVYKKALPMNLPEHICSVVSHSLPQGSQIWQPPED